MLVDRGDLWCLLVFCDADFGRRSVEAGTFRVGPVRTTRYVPLVDEGNSVRAHDGQPSNSSSVMPTSNAASSMSTAWNAGPSVSAAKVEAMS